MIYSVLQGVRNVVLWAPVIWKDRDWDWAYFARIMRFKLIRMAEHEETEGHHVTSLHDAKLQRICACLLGRLLADEYFDNAQLGGFHSPCDGSDRYLKLRKPIGTIFDHAEMMAKQDVELFGKMLGKHMRSWWD